MLDEIIGGSPAICRLRKLFPSISSDARPLIIHGKAGVGKTLLAAHIHEAAVRGRLRPPETLNFSILAEREQRIGLFGGAPPELCTTRKSILEFPTTVILKHLDYAGRYLQEKLAESLLAMKVSRLSSKDSRPIACRLILTFREPPSKLLEEGRLSPALFERFRYLNKYHVPSLRERPEDIPLLAKYYLDKFYAELSKSMNGAISHLRGFSSGRDVDPALLEIMKNHAWRENVRDLKAFIRCLVMFPYEEEICQEEKIEVMKMLIMLEEGNEFSIHDSLSRIQAGILERALKKFNKRISGAARILGISDRSFRRLMTQRR